jgi:hypothetical protein
MKNNRDSQSNEPQGTTKGSDKNNTDIDLAKSTELFNQALTALGPLLKFHEAADELTMDDVRMYWDVRVIRGSDTALAHLKGSSTLHKLIAPEMLLTTTERIELELRDKIVIPMVGIFQTEATRMVLDITAADDAARASDDRSDDDLL